MKAKIKTILLTILIFSLVEFAVYICYTLWDIEDGLSGNRPLTEQEISDISIILTDYFNRQENKPDEWKISYSYFAEAVYDNPVANQYVVNVNYFYKNEKKNYSFTMLQGLKSYHIDTIEQCYVSSE